MCQCSREGAHGPQWNSRRRCCFLRCRSRCRGPTYKVGQVGFAWFSTKNFVCAVAGILRPYQRPIAGDGRYGRMQGVVAVARRVSRQMAVQIWVIARWVGRRKPSHLCCRCFASYYSKTSREGGEMFQGRAADQPQSLARPLRCTPRRRSGGLGFEIANLL